jgi:PTH1 family peptidyl-tRNA hydrolase
MRSLVRKLIRRRPAPHAVRDDWWLIVGLGNPGTDYALSRHNVGYRVAELLATRLGVRFEIGKCESRIAEGEFARRGIAIARPGTYMNRSGMAVKGLVRRYRVPLDRLVVVYDDINLPLGRLRVRASGRAGGHNGMKSIIMYVHSADFPRVRIGIGLPEGMRDATGHVLGPFTGDEQPAIEEACARAADAVLAIVESGISEAMNRYNPTDGAASESGPALP